MSWEEILNRHGFGWTLTDLWYRMFSNKPSAYSIKKYLQRNIKLTRGLINNGTIPVFKAKSRDLLVMDIFMWVTKTIKYAYDFDVHKQMEYWEDVDELLERKQGDCESTSTLFYCICRVNRINPLQIRYVFGGKWVYRDHVFVEYMADETMNWHILDTAYAPHNITPFKYRTVAGINDGYVEKRTYISDFEVK